MVPVKLDTINVMLVLIIIFLIDSLVYILSHHCIDLYQRCYYNFRPKLMVLCHTHHKRCTNFVSSYSKLMYNNIKNMGLWFIELYVSQSNFSWCKSHNYNGSYEYGFIYPLISSKPIWTWAKSVWNRFDLFMDQMSYYMHLTPTRLWSAW